ncbi:MAG: BACON domain-containing carbohydrate-binding protein [Candidatus Sumerlaeia bacterium]|nr:BACON domain-containing carbohydrate-binding protein [Candidatus Sumerlaeia bacterium]
MIRIAIGLGALALALLTQLASPVHAQQRFGGSDATGAPCSYTLAPTAGSTLEFPAGAFSLPVTVSTAPGCFWDADTGASWLSVAPETFFGSSAAFVTAQANPGGPRSTTVTIAGGQFTANQAGVPCTYTVTPPSAGELLAGAIGAAFNYNVATRADCFWTTSDSAAWITVSPETAYGPSAVSVTVASNPGAERTGSFTIAGASYQLRQSAADCTFAVTPTPAGELLASAGGASFNYNVATRADCFWTTSDSAAWITVSPASNTGPSAVSVSIDSNSGAERTGSFTIAGASYQVRQSAPDCTYTVTPPSAGELLAAATGASLNYNVATRADCFWTTSDSASWITVSPETAYGPSAVSVTVASNSGAERTGSFTIAGASYQVRQSAADCTYLLNPPTALELFFTPAGGDVSVEVLTGEDCPWGTESALGWITISPETSYGPGTATVTASPNPGGDRTGTVRIAGSTFNVRQLGGPCSYTVTPPPSGELLAAAGGASFNYNVATRADCFWTTSDSASWITVSPETAYGPSAVSVAVASNSGAERTGSFTIAGASYQVRQSAANCSYTVTPPPAGELLAGATGASFNYNVATRADCFWTTSDSAAWITVSPETAYGPSAVSVTVASNSGAERTGSFTIAGASYQLRQSAADCTFAVTPPPAGELLAGATGAAFNYNVATRADCFWTTSDSASWITVSPETAYGPSAVSVAVASNSGAERTGSFTIAGASYQLRQLAAPCSYVLNPPPSLELFFTQAGGSVPVSVSTRADCPWGTESAFDWIVAAPETAYGPGTATVTAPANTGGERTGTVRIAGATFNVRQLGAPCAFEVLPPPGRIVRFSPGGGSKAFTVVTRGDCEWGSFANVDWLTFEAETRYGPGMVTVTASRNSSITRNGRFTIAGKTYDASQSGNLCSYEVTPPPPGSMSEFDLVAYIGESREYYVDTRDLCDWTATSDSAWISVRAETNYGPGAVKVRIDRNTGTRRQGTFTIAGVPYPVTQASLLCRNTVTPLSVPQFPAAGGSSLVTVSPSSTECVWTVENLPAWLAAAPLSGQGNGTVTLSASANATYIRTATIRIAGRNVTVSQRFAGSDPFEPNNDPAQGGAAPPLPSGPNVPVLMTADDDWYRLVLPACSAFRVTVTHDPSLGDINAQLFDSRCTDGGGFPLSLAGSFRPGGFDELVYTDRSGGASGEYFLRCYSEGPVTSLPYNIRVQPLGIDDVFEPNNAPCEVSSISLGTRYTDLILKDDDIFRVPTLGAGRIDVEVAAPSGSGQLYFQILRDDGSCSYDAISGFYDPNIDTMRIEGVDVAGLASVLVRVYPAATQNSNVYSLLVAPSASPVAQAEESATTDFILSDDPFLLWRDLPRGAARGSDDAFEPNNNPLEAASVPIVPFGPTPNLVLANEDWYRIALSDCGALRIDADFNPAEGNLRIQLLETRCTSTGGFPLFVAQGSSTAGRESVAFVDRFGSAGSVLLRVYSDAGYTGQRYTLTLTNLGIDDAFEPNSSPCAPGLFATGAFGTASATDLVLKDDDVYRIGTAAYSALRIEVEHNPQSGQLYFMVLEDACAFNVITGFYTPNTGAMVIDNLPLAGRSSVLVRVYGTGGATNVYNLRVTGITAP